jgi:hypothetical protein
MAVRAVADAQPVRYLAPSGDPPCEACRARPAEVLVLIGDEGFRVCVECAADGIRERRARMAGEVTS